MTKQRLGSLILTLITALALAAFVAAPAFAHHKDGHDNGQAADEEEATSEESGTDDSGDDSGDGGWSRTSSSRESQPDPEPSQAPQSTTGPSDCGDYSQEENGPYDHDSCDNSQGMHGSGGNGKCAGCTGLADDKSPGGQSRNDHNNGYECDNNGGVGKGNPPHARCSAPPTGNVCVGTECIPPTDLCPEGTAMAGKPPGPNGCDVKQRVDKVCPPGTDRAGQDMRNLKDCDDDSVLPNVITRRVTPVGPRTVVKGAVLPFTGGGGVTTFAALGFMLIALGTLSLRARKTT
jgi:hypothetical protein